MRRALVVVGLGGLLAGGVAAPALGGAAQQTHPQAAKVFKSTVRPSKNVRPGTTLKVTSSKAKKNTKYYCVLIVIHGANYGANLNSAALVKSNKHGHITCTKTFAPYTVTDQSGKTRHCPTTRADRKAGFSCAVSLADQATQGQTSASVAKFSARK